MPQSYFDIYLEQQNFLDQENDPEYSKLDTIGQNYSIDIKKPDLQNLPDHLISRLNPEENTIKVTKNNKNKDNLINRKYNRF